MPFYTITDTETKRSMKVKSDSAPSEVEAAELFTTAKAEPSKKTVAYRELGSRGVEFLKEAWQELDRQYGGPIYRIATGTNQLGMKSEDSMAAVDELAQNLKPSLRLSPLLLPGFSGYRAMGVLRQGLAAGLTAATTENLAGGTPQEQAASAISAFGSSYNPGFKAAQAGWVRGVQYAGSSVLGAAVQGVTEFTAQTARGKSLKEAVSAAKIPALVGGGFGLAGQLGKTFEAYAEESAKATAAFGKNIPLAISSPTLFGGTAAKAERMGADIGIAQIERQVGDEFIAQIGKQVDGAEVVSRLQPFVGKLDEGRARLASLSQDSLAANESLAMAEAALREGRANAYSLTGEARDKLVGNLKEAANRAAASQARDIANNAYNLQQLRLSGSYVAPATARNMFVEKVMAPLDAHIKQRAGVLQEAIGIPANVEFISGADVWNSIRGTPAYKGAGSLRTADIDAMVAPMLKVAGADGKPVFRTLSRDDVQLIRQKLWDMHDADIPGAPKLVTATLEQMDGAIKGSTERAVLSFKPDAAEPLKEFNRYWGEMAKAKSDRSTRALFTTNPNDEIITNLVGDVVKDGVNASSYTGVIKYIDAAASGNPAVQQEMKSHVFGLIRDNLITRNFGAKDPFLGPVVDLVGLSDNLAKLQKGGFPVLETGLNPAMIRETAKLAGAAGLGRNITGAEFAAIMQNPAVKEAVAAGQKTEPIIKRVANELGALRAYKESRWLEIAKKTGAARKARDTAESRAKVAGKELSEITAGVEDMSKDPLFVAFSGAKNFGINGKGHADFESFLSYIGNTNKTTGADVSSLLHAINEKSPEMREQIAIHTLSKTVEFLSKNQLTGERGVDWSAVGKFIDPANPITGELTKNRIRTIVGDSIFSKLMANMPRIEILRGVNRQRQAVAFGRANLAEAGTAARGAVQGASGQGFGATLRSVSDLIGLGEYHLAAFAMAIPGADKALNAGASMSEIIQKLGPQRAYIMLQGIPPKKQPTP